MAFSGLRLQSLGNYTGTDGIRLGDCMDLTGFYGLVSSLGFIGIFVFTFAIAIHQILSPPFH